MQYKLCCINIICYYSPPVMKFDSNSVIRSNFFDPYFDLYLWGCTIQCIVSQVTSGPDKCLVKQQSFHYPELAKANKS